MISFRDQRFERYVCPWLAVRFTNKAKRLLIPLESQAPRSPLGCVQACRSILSLLQPSGVGENSREHCFPQPWPWKRHRERGLRASQGAGLCVCGRAQEWEACSQSEAPGYKHTASDTPSQRIGRRRGSVWGQSGDAGFLPATGGQPFCSRQRSLAAIWWWSLQGHKRVGGEMTGHRREPERGRWPLQLDTWHHP